MSSRVKRTYSRRNRSTLSSSPPPPEDPATEPPTSSPSSTPPSSPIPKRSLSEVLNSRPPAKKLRLPRPDAKKTKSSSSRWKSNTHKQSLIQLHFSIDTSVLRTCPICDLSYTKGAQDDEALHKSHCARVQRGLEWTKDEIKESAKHGVVEIESGIRLKDGSHGRILAVNANVVGKIGSKLVALFETINLALSSPPLAAQTLADSKVYLFLLTPPISSAVKSSFVGATNKPNGRQREKIAGCVIAQPIVTAMCVIEGADELDHETPIGTGTCPIQSDVRETLTYENSPSSLPSAAHIHSKDMITVDASTSLYCSPEPLPTPLGISRMFVSSSYRRLGIASRLLTAAADNFIHGVTLDPVKGEVAFTQPTASGKALMEKWGKKGARIYRE